MDKGFGIDPSFLLFGLLIVALVAMVFSSRNAKKRQQAQRDKMKTEMVPGAWVMTTSGFYGRYVETDGDVVVLETADGVETYWLSRAIATVTTPPFASQEEVAAQEQALEAQAGSGDEEEAAASPVQQDNAEGSETSKPADEEQK